MRTWGGGQGVGGKRGVEVQPKTATINTSYMIHTLHREVLLELKAQGEIGSCRETFFTALVDRIEARTRKIKVQLGTTYILGILEPDILIDCFSTTMSTGSILTACHRRVARASHMARSLAVPVVVTEHLRASAPAFVSVLYV